MNLIGEIQTAVAEQARKHNLNLAVNNDHNLAYAAARRARPELFAVSKRPQDERPATSGFPASKPHVEDQTEYLLYRC